MGGWYGTPPHPPPPSGAELLKGALGIPPSRSAHPCGRGGGGRRGSGTQNCVHHKWPDRIVPTVIFGYPHDGPFGLGESNGRFID